MRFKMTPAHDFNDFEVGRRQNLEVINIFDAHASVNDNAPEAYRGLDRFVARERVLADLEDGGFLDRVEDHVHTVPHGDRSHEVVEPWLTDQWFVDAETLAAPAIKAVEDGATVFVPEELGKDLFRMDAQHPALVRFAPALVGPSDPGVVWAGRQVLRRGVRSGGPGRRRSALRQAPTELTRDEDVLDTWFSSALWPFSTLGWPEETPELERYYKTDVLVTGFDIIFFWVARMMMMGLHFMKDENGVPEVPFHTVYIHALVRDEKGQKMSKSKGNVIDPLELIDEYGADALRFTLAAMAAQGRDIKLAASRVEGYRNFATKLWNASRFCEMNQCVAGDGFDIASCRQDVNRWIAGEVERTAKTVTQGIEAHRYNEAAGALYQFVWGVFCDWYLELIKPSLTGEDEAAKAETKQAAGWALDQILLLLHPFMPFVTEELWTRFGEAGARRASALIQAEWPSYDGLQDEAVAAELDWVIRLISEVRSVRSEMNVPAGSKVPVVIAGAGETTRARVAAWRSEVSLLARLESIDLADEVPESAVQIVLDEATVALPLGGVIDIAAESDRLQKELGKIGDEISKIEAKLANEKFTSRAPDHVVEEQRERKADAEDRRAKILDAVERLKGVA